MAGTLFGLPLSQQMDANGDPLSGCLLYLYEASTSTPVISYADFGLTTENSNPLEADSSGRIPQFWLDDGSYRARLTTAEGVEVFDIDVIQALGPSVASSGGGGSGSTVDATSVFSTGDMLWKPITGTRTGWVRSNGRTIGSASSGATERANADTSSLYDYLWTNFSDTLCPVSGGRGGTAPADFAANKAIGTLDMRARAAFGLDDMGNSAAGIITGGTTGGQSSGGMTPTYHEASWTPAIQFGGATTGITYTTQVGRYVRIDDMITVWGTIVLSDAGSATGSATIAGLPYTASTVSGQNFSGTIGRFSDLDIASIAQSVGLYISSAATSISLVIGDAAQDLDDALTRDEFLDTTAISFTVTYRTDDTTEGTTGSVAVEQRLGNWFVKL